MVRSIVYTEPEWSRGDVNALLEDAAVERDTGDYGERVSEATSPQASPYYKGPDRIRYEADGPYVNQAARAVEQAMHAYETKYKDADRSGHRWRVKKIERP